MPEIANRAEEGQDHQEDEIEGGTEIVEEGADLDREMIGGAVTEEDLQEVPEASHQDLGIEMTLDLLITITKANAETEETETETSVINTIVTRNPTDIEMIEEVIEGTEWKEEVNTIHQGGKDQDQTKEDLDHQEKEITETNQEKEALIDQEDQKDPECPTEDQHLGDLKFRMDTSLIKDQNQEVMIGTEEMT